MSLTDIGLNFKMTGGDSFEQQMKQMTSSFQSMSSTLGGSTLKGHLDKMEGHFSAMHKGIKSQLHLTELAIGAFMTGRAIKGLSSWVLGGAGAAVDQQKDYLRIHGATTEGLKNMAESLNELASVRPFDKLAGWSIGENVMSMLGGLDDPKLVQRAMNANSNLSYLLGAQGDMAAAMNLSTPFVAGFGAKLDPSGKIDLLDKFNSYIKYLTDNTQLRGPDIQNILPQTIGPYLGAGLSPEKMFAHMGILDFLRGQSGEVLKNMFGKEGKSFGAIGAELDKQSYLADLQTNPAFRAKEAARVFREHGERLKSNIRSEADLPKSLQHELNAQVSNRKMDYEAQGGRLLAEGNTKKYAALMLGAINRLKQLQGITGKSVNSIIAEHFGETSIKGIFPFLEAVAAGKDDQMVEAMRGQAANASSLTGELNSKFQSLGAKAKTFEDAVSGLTGDLRRTLEPGTIEVLSGWQRSLEAARKKIQEAKQESQISQNIKDVISGTRGGIMEAIYGKGASNAQSSLDDAIMSFAQSLSQPGWKEAGEKFGKAIGEFVVVLGQLKHIIGTLSNAIDWVTKGHKAGAIAGTYAAMRTPGPPAVKVGVGLGVGLGVDMLTADPNENFLGIPGSHWVKKGVTNMITGPEPPEVMSSRQMRTPYQPTDQLQSAHTPAAPRTIYFQPTNIIQLDSKVIAEELRPMVKEEVEGEVDERLTSGGRNRANALDWGSFP